MKISSLSPPSSFFPLLFFLKHYYFSNEHSWTLNEVLTKYYSEKCEFAYLPSMMIRRNGPSDGQNVRRVHKSDQREVPLASSIILSILSFRNVRFCGSSGVVYVCLSTSSTLSYRMEGFF